MQLDVIGVWQSFMIFGAEGNRIFRRDRFFRELYIPFRNFAFAVVARCGFDQRDCQLGGFQIQNFSIDVQRASGIHHRFDMIEGQPLAWNTDAHANGVIKRGHGRPDAHNLRRGEDEERENSDKNRRRGAAGQRHGVGHAHNCGLIGRAHREAGAFTHRFNRIGNILNRALDIFKQLFRIGQLKPLLAAGRAFDAFTLRRKGLRGEQKS
jgi:hypothetical protein